MNKTASRSFTTLGEDQQPFAIPDHWKWATIGEVTSFVGSGVTPRGGQSVYTSTGVPFIRSQNVLRCEINLADVAFIPAEVHASMDRTHLRGGETLLNITGASIGRATMFPYGIQTANVNQHVCILRFSDLVYPKFPQYWLNSPVLQSILMDEQAGVTRQGLNYEQVRDLPIPIPPLGEQKAIVEKVESLIGRLKEASRTILEVQVGARVRREQILHSAFCGDLTKKWRESLEYPTFPTVSGIDDAPYEIPDSWVWVKLDDVCVKIVDGTHHSPKSFATGDFKYITAKNIKEHGLVLDDVTYVTSDVHQEIYKRCDVKKNDVLYIKDGATTGVAILNTLEEEFSLLSSVCVLRPDPRYLLPEYLTFALNSPTVKSRMLGVMSGNAIARLTLKKIKNSTIPVPSLEEQQRIVKLLRHAMGLENGIESLLNQRDYIYRITEAVLLHAFRGQLTQRNKKARISNLQVK